MSDSKFVPRIAGGDTEDGVVDALECFTAPGANSRRWSLPAPEAIIELIEDRGGSIDILVNDALQYHLARNNKPIFNRDVKILLGALIRSIRSDEQTKKDWDLINESNEQMQLIAAVSRMNQMIENDAYKAQAGPLIKFALERRDHRYSRTAAPVNDEELEAIEKLRAIQYGKKPTRAEPQ